MGIVNMIFNENKGKMKAVVEKNGKKYILMIPSRYFPLSQPSKIRIFDYRNTERIVDDNVISLLNSIDAKMGYCYSNSDNVYKLLSSKGYDVKYYSGWLFIDDVPIHHAWVMLEGNKLIDLSISEKNWLDYVKLNDERGTVDIEARRANYVEAIKNNEQLPNSIKYACGKASRSPLSIYIGSESTIDSAREMFAKAKAELDSPLHKLTDGGMNLNGASKLQEMYYEQQKNR